MNRVNITDNELVEQTVEQMWKEFWRNSNPNRPGRKAPSEVHVAYYAGSHAMLAKMLALFRLGASTGDDFAQRFQKWGDEMEKFVHDYNAGKI